MPAFVVTHTSPPAGVVTFGPCSLCSRVHRRRHVIRRRPARRQPTHQIDLISRAGVRPQRVEIRPQRRKRTRRHRRHSAPHPASSHQHFGLVLRIKNVRRIKRGAVTAHLFAAHGQRKFIRCAINSASARINVHVGIRRIPRRRRPSAHRAISAIAAVHRSPLRTLRCRPRSRRPVPLRPAQHGVLIRRMQRQRNKLRQRPNRPARH